MYEVEIYGRVRRAVRVEGRSQRAVAKEYGLSRGEELKYVGIEPAVNRSYIYRSTPAKCRECSVKDECTSGRLKQIVIHVEQAVRQRARERTREAVFFRHQRSQRKVDALFGELKNQFGLRRVRLPDLSTFENSSSWRLPPRTSNAWSDISHRHLRAATTGTQSCKKSNSPTPSEFGPLPSGVQEFLNSYKIRGHFAEVWVPHAIHRVKRESPHGYIAPSPVQGNHAEGIQYAARPLSERLRANPDRKKVQTTIRILKHNEHVG